jgi:hypothetical protein
LIETTSNIASPVNSFLRVTFTTTPLEGTVIPGSYVRVFDVKVSPSTTTLISPVFKAPQLNTIVCNTISSSPDLLGLTVNSAIVFLDLRRTVFLALELIFKVPCSTTLTFTVSSSASPAGLLSSSSHSSLMLNVSEFPVVVAFGVISISTLTSTDLPSATSISSIVHNASHVV